MLSMRTSTLREFLVGLVNRRLWNFIPATTTIGMLTVTRVEHLLRLLEEYQPHHLDSLVWYGANFAWSEIPEVYEDAAHPLPTPDTEITLFPVLSEFCQLSQLCFKPGLMELVQEDLELLKGEWPLLTLATDCLETGRAPLTVGCLEGVPDAKSYAWAHSPVIRVCSSLNEYLASLSKKRRYKFKSSGYTDKPSYTRVYQGVDYSRLSGGRVVENVVGAFRCLENRWKDDPYSLQTCQRQVMMTSALGSQAVTRVKYLTDESGAETYAGFIRQHETLKFQFLADGGTFTGTHMLSDLVANILRTRSAHHPLYIDVGCINGFVDLEDDLYYVYKRNFCNMDSVKPMLMATTNQDLDGSPPFYRSGSGMVLPDGIDLLGSPL